MSAEIPEDVLARIQEALQSDEEPLYVTANIADIMQEAGYSLEKEEKEAFNPDGKTMWEIEEIVPYIRTYFIPGRTGEEALAFFKSGNDGELDGSDLYEFFSTQEDMADGNGTEEATLVGRAGGWVRYRNEMGEAERED